MYTTTTTAITYDGALPFSAPITTTVRDAAGVTHRAEYVPGSMTDCPAARYVVEGRLCELRPSGDIVPLASEERRAA